MTEFKIIGHKLNTKNINYVSIYLPRTQGSRNLNPILFIITSKNMLQHINLTKHKQDLQVENYNMLIKEIKGLNKWRHISHSLAEKFNIDSWG